MRLFVRLLEILLWVLLSPLFARIALSRTSQKQQIQFQLCSEFLSLWPFQIGALARRVFYRQTLARCGVNPVIRMGACFIYPQAEIGNNVFIGNRCVIGLAMIGDDAMLAHQVSLLSGRHHHSPDQRDSSRPLRLQEGRLEKITIGRNAWIGANAVVMADVGENAVVGAGAVVVKPIAAGKKVVGNPAKEI